jgi:hypothetical protein
MQSVVVLIFRRTGKQRFQVPPGGLKETSNIFKEKRDAQRRRDNYLDKVTAGARVNVE